jgi:nucleoside-diphosphate-sugar epimerase
MKYFITGVSGFIGYHLAEHLMKQGHDVAGVDNFKKDEAINRIRNTQLHRISDATGKYFTCYNMDILDKDLKDIIAGEKPDVFVHLAAITGIRSSILIPDEVYRVNVDGTAHVNEIAGEIGVKCFFNASSSSVYGDSPVPFIEDKTIPNPKGIYALCKLKAEHVVAFNAHKYKMRSISGRFFTVYGPYGRSDMAVHQFITAALIGSAINIYGTGCQRRDFTYVEDLVRSIYKLIEAEGPLYDTVNIGTGSCVSLNKLIEYITAVTDKCPVVVYQESNSVDVRHTRADINKLTKLINSVPDTYIYAGLHKTMSWICDHYSIKHPKDKIYSETKG